MAQYDAGSTHDFPPEVKANDLFSLSVPGIRYAPETVSPPRLRPRSAKKSISTPLKSCLMLSQPLFSEPTWLFPITHNFIQPPSRQMPQGSLPHTQHHGASQ